MIHLFADGIVPTPGGRFAPVTIAKAVEPKQVASEDLGPAALRLGMSGAATAFSDHEGPIAGLASILLWIKAYAMFFDASCSRRALGWPLWVRSRQRDASARFESGADVLD